MTGHGSQLHDDPNDISTLDGDLRIGEFLVRPLLKQVVRIGEDGAPLEEHSLPDKAVSVLVYLAKHARQVCTRDDILDAVWGEDRDAYDRVLDNAVAEIRRVFGDDARKPSYVQTVPRVGYRLLQTSNGALPRDQKRQLGSLTQTGRPADRAKIAHPARQKRRVLAVAVLVLLLILLGVLLLKTERTLSKGLTLKVSYPNDLEVDSLVSRENINHMLYESHFCGEHALIRPIRYLERADITVEVSTQEKEGSQVASARVSSARHDRLQFARTTIDPPASPTQQYGRSMASSAFSREVRNAVDRTICETPSLPKRSRACHCLSGASSPASTANRPTQIIRSLQRAVDLDPDLIAAYELLATSYFRMADHQKEVETIEAGLGRVVSVDSVRGIELQRSLARANGDFELAWQLSARLVRLEPESWERKVELAWYLSAHQNACESAIRLLEPLNHQLPRQAAIEYELARAYSFCRRIDDGISLARRTHLRLPNDINALSSLIAFLVEAGGFDEATVLARELMARRPSDPGAYWALGGLAADRGRYSEANHWLEKSLERSYWPIDRAYVLSFKAEMAWRRGSLEECIAAATEMIPLLRKGSLTGHWMQLVCHTELGNHTAARNLAREIHQTINLTGSSYEQWMVPSSRALIEVYDVGSERSLDRIVDGFRLGAEAHLMGSEANFLAGEALAKNGHPWDAVPFFVEALRANKNHAWSNCYLGLIYKNERLVIKAGTHLRDAIEIFGNPPEDPLGMQCAKALAELDPNFTLAN